MRLFLCLVLFDIVFRSLSVLLPCKEWHRQLGVSRFPHRLPTRREMAELAAKRGPDDSHPVFDRVMASADDVWGYFQPWPGPETRPQVRSWADSGKWVVCWLNSRLEFVENLAGINEYWPMFSPTVRTTRWMTRGRLVYEDGSERVVHNHGDPADLTRFSHWNEEKILQHELKVDEDREDECRGYCNLLAHRYPASEDGKSLRKIFLYQVRYRLSPPGEDAAAFYLEQMQLTREKPRGEQVYPDFYEYDARAQTGKTRGDK
jgi:hypothetical protein